MQNLKKENKENIEKEIINFKAIGKITIFGTNLLFKSPIFYLVAIFFPLLLVMSLTIMLPYWFCFSMIISLSLVLAGGMSFAGLYFGFSQSTISQNVQLTNVGKKAKLISIYLNMVLTTFLTTCFVMLFLIFFENIGYSVAQSSFTSFDPEPIMHWSDIWWWTIIYYWALTTTIIFMGSLFLSKYLKTKKIYLIILFLYFITSFFLAGTMSITWTFDNGSFSQIKVGTPEAEMFGALEPMLWGEVSWFMGQAFPTYQMNQLIFNSLLPGLDVSNMTQDGGPSTALINSVNNINTSYIFIPSRDGWIYYFSMPYFWCLIFMLGYNI